MKNLIIGIVLILLGICCGLYVGGYLMLFKGIVLIINEIKSSEALRASAIAWGIIKIKFAGLTGFISAAFFIVPGKYIIEKADL